MKVGEFWKPKPFFISLNARKRKDYPTAAIFDRDRSVSLICITELMTDPDKGEIGLVSFRYIDYYIKNDEGKTFQAGGSELYNDFLRYYERDYDYEPLERI